MKTKLLFFVSALTIAFSSFSQEEFDFDLHYKPETEYKVKIEQNMTSTTTFSGSKEMMKQMKSSGIENPTKTTMTMSYELLYVTGKLNENNVFPIQTTYIKTPSFNGVKSIPDGTAIYGEAEQGKAPFYDSVYSEKEIPEAVKKSLIETVQATAKQLELPSRKIKKGESFVHTTPFVLPMEGVSLEMDITSTYKVLSIKDGIAVLDVKMTYTMKTGTKGMNMNATGTGKGKMTYSIANSFFTAFDVESKMTMKMSMEDMKADIVLLMSTSQAAEIVKL